MSYQNEKIQKKIALMHAKNSIKQFSNLELINFENKDSSWLALYENTLKQFRQIDSEPTYSRPIENSDNDLSWLKNSLDFFKEKKEWLIVVPNCPLPVWANVKVLDFSKALEELWEEAESGDIIIADKSTGQVIQVFSEEKDYEIHIGKCEVTNVDEKN